MAHCTRVDIFFACAAARPLEKAMTICASSATMQPRRKITQMAAKIMAQVSFTVCNERSRTWTKIAPDRLKRKFTKTCVSSCVCSFRTIVSRPTIKVRWLTRRFISVCQVWSCLETLAKLRLMGITVMAAFSFPTGSGNPSIITEDVGAKRRLGFSCRSDFSKKARIHPCLLLLVFLEVNPSKPPCNNLLALGGRFPTGRPLGVRGVSDTTASGAGRSAVASATGASYHPSLLENGSMGRNHW
mmetsp:Transcript_7344/g.12003  ORF Transcript_7344/g.12003 Transcript_7344/m.12003 type:complete len:243 (+) Transcript_7344:101-829(+)